MYRPNPPNYLRSSEKSKTPHSTSSQRSGHPATGYLGEAWHYTLCYILYGVVDDPQKFRPNNRFVLHRIFSLYFSDHL